jgi:hypothetical protein
MSDRREEQEMTSEGETSVPYDIVDRDAAISATEEYCGTYAEFGICLCSDIIEPLKADGIVDILPAIGRPCKRDGFWELQAQLFNSGVKAARDAMERTAVAVEMPE